MLSFKHHTIPKQRSNIDALYMQMALSNRTITQWTHRRNPHGFYHAAPQHQHDLQHYLQTCTLSYTCTSLPPEMFPDVCTLYFHTALGDVFSNLALSLLMPQNLQSLRHPLCLCRPLSLHIEVHLLLLTAWCLEGCLACCPPACPPPPPARPCPPPCPPLSLHIEVHLLLLTAWCLEGCFACCPPACHQHIHLIGALIRVDGLHVTELQEQGKVTVLNFTPCGINLWNSKRKREQRDKKGLNPYKNLNAMQALPE